MDIISINTAIINNLFQRIENLRIIKPVEYKFHPTASMIKESFRNINDGDILGFNKSYFLKCYRKTIQTIFLVSNKTEYFWNNLYQKSLLNNIKPVEYKIHPTASMIKESFKNIGDGDILGFDKLYFLKCYKKTVHTIFLVSNKTEYFWNNRF